MTDAWHSAKIRQFERVMAGPSIALLRVNGKTSRRRASSTERPTLIAETSHTTHRFVAIPSPPDERGIVRAAYSVPAEIATGSTQFSLDLGDGQIIALPAPTAGLARVPPPDDDAREVLRVEAQPEPAPVVGNERRGDPIDKLVELSSALADAEQALTHRDEALAAAEADLAAADDRARQLEARITELETQDLGTPETVQADADEARAEIERARAEADQARADVERAQAAALVAAEQAAADAEAVVQQAHADAQVSVDQARAEAQAAVAQAQADARVEVEQAHADAQAAIEQGQEDVRAQLEQAHADAQAAIEQAHADAQATVEQGRADAQAAIERAAEELDARVAEAQAAQQQRAEEAERRAEDALLRAMAAEELVESLRTRSEQLETELGEARARLAPLEAELATARTALARSELERDEAVDEMRKMARERDELQRQAEAFDQVAIKARERATEAESARDASAASLSELQVWRGELERRLTATTTELAAMTADHKEDSRELKRMRGALAEAEARLELGQAQAAGGGAPIDAGAAAREAALRTRVAALLAERDEVSRRAEQLTMLLDPNQQLTQLAANLSRAREHAEGIQAAVDSDLPGPDDETLGPSSAIAPPLPAVDRAAELDVVTRGAEAEAAETAERELAEASRGPNPTS